jgi:hypothetical protein
MLKMHFMTFGTEITLAIEKLTIPLKKSELAEMVLGVSAILTAGREDLVKIEMIGSNNPQR